MDNKDFLEFINSNWLFYSIFKIYFLKCEKFL